MAAGISGKIWPEFNIPLDFGLKFRGQRVFGDHKTVRGMVFGVAIGAAVYFIQINLTSVFPILRQVEVNDFGEFKTLSLLLPFGALTGDAVKSFFKRQLDVAPGKSWFPFDQIDWLLGSMIFSSLIIKLDFYFGVLVIAVGVVLHIAIKMLGFSLKLQQEKF